MFSHTRKLTVSFELFQNLVMCNECLIRFVYPFIHKILKLTFAETFISNFVRKRYGRYLQLLELFLNSVSFNLYLVINSLVLDISICDTLLHIFFLMFSRKSVICFQLFFELGF